VDDWMYGVCGLLVVGGMMFIGGGVGCSVGFYILLFGCLDGLRNVVVFCVICLLFWDRIMLIR